MTAVMEVYPHPCPLPARGRETLSTSHRLSRSDSDRSSSTAFKADVSSPPAGERQGGGYSVRTGFGGAR